MKHGGPLVNMCAMISECCECEGESVFEMLSFTHAQHFDIRTALVGASLLALTACRSAKQSGGMISHPDEPVIIRRLAWLISTPSSWIQHSGSRIFILYL